MSDYEAVTKSPDEIYSTGDGQCPYCGYAFSNNDPIPDVYQTIWACDDCGWEFYLTVETVRCFTVQPIEGQGNERPQS